MEVSLFVELLLIGLQFLEISADNNFLPYLHPFLSPDNPYFGSYDYDFHDIQEELRHLTSQYDALESEYQDLATAYQNMDQQSTHQQYPYDTASGYSGYGASYPVSYVDPLQNPYGSYYGAPGAYGYGSSNSVPFAKEQSSYEPYSHNVGYQGGSHERSYKPRYPPQRTYKPVKLPIEKEKKMKIISIDKGFYVPGGTQVFGKFKSVKGCMKACAESPSCFAGDYNPWTGRCFFHSNQTACGTLKSHKKVVHFKKVPCTVPEAPLGLIILGAQLFYAIEQKGIDDLSTCLKKCASTGSGIPLTVANIDEQICFGIDFDFSSHKCYFHVRNTNPANRICGSADPIPTPRDLIANPSTVFIALCPNIA